jgi:hypothetical protein
VAARKGKKTEEGTMMWPLRAESSPMAIADSPEAQTLTPATTKEGSDIVRNCKPLF